MFFHHVLKLVLEGPGFVPLRANLTHFEAQSDIPDTGNSTHLVSQLSPPPLPQLDLHDVTISSTLHKQQHKAYTCPHIIS